MIVVTDNASRNRFEAHDGETLAGFADYVRTDEMIAVVHTEVRSAFEGKGVGSALARDVYASAEATSTKVLAICPFIQGWIARHPDLQHLEYRAHSDVTD